MYTGIIYERVNTINGKKYIGQTIRPKRRGYDFYKRNRKYGGDYINNARNKYGADCFETNILTSIYSTDKEELHNTLNRLETLYIEVFNTKVPNGYNLSEGGQGTMGCKLTTEQKDKLRKINLGKHHTEETRRKMSESHKGLKGNTPTEETIKKMILKMGKRINMYDLEHNFIRSFLSIREAARIMNIDHISISRCCNKKQKTTNGYIFKFSNDAAQNTLENNDTNTDKE